MYIGEPMIHFIPDWKTTYTPKEAEEEFDGFKFTGAGWYFLKNGQTMLVMPTSIDTHFYFCIYSKNPADAFNWVVNAPTRVDER